MKALIFLLHPAFVIAYNVIEWKINVNLAENCAVEDYKTDSTGKQFIPITEAERSSFKLDDESLMDYFDSYWRVRPKEILLHSSTFLKEILPVAKVLEPIFSSVTKMNTTQEFTRKAYKNDGDAPKDVNVGLYTIIEDKIRVSSSNAIGNLTGEEIVFEVNVHTSTKRLGRVFPRKIRAPWGMDFKKDYKMRVGETNGFVYRLDPGQSVLAELQVTKHVFQIEVGYLAWMYGHVGFAFDDRPRLRLEDVPELQIKNVTVTQVIDIEIYTDARLFVVDKTALCKLGEKDYGF